MATELAIQGTFDVSEIVDGFDDIGSAAAEMGDEVGEAAQTAGDAAAEMDSLNASAAGMSSTSRAATGALTGMSAGLDAIGLSGAADALDTAAVATKTFSGITKAWTVVNKAAAVGQWALNAAMSANPIGLVVIAIAALVAGLVLAYNKSETFRKIVDTAMAGAKAAIGWVVDKVSDLVDLVKDHAGPIFETLSDAVGDAKDLVVNYFDLMTTPIQKVIDLVKDLIDWIKDIDFPDLPDLNPFGRVAGRGGTGGAAAGGSTIIYVTIEGAVDPVGTARQIQQLGARYGNVVLGQAVG